MKTLILVLTLIVPPHGATLTLAIENIPNVNTCELVAHKLARELDASAMSYRCVTKTRGAVTRYSQSL